MTRLRIPREDWHLPDVAEQLCAPRRASLVLSGLTGMVRKQWSPEALDTPRGSWHTQVGLVPERPL